MLHIVPSYYPAIQLGGPIQSVHEINKALVKKGVTVHVLTLMAGLEHHKEIKPKIWRNYDGVKVMYLDYLKFTKYNFSTSFAANLIKIIKNYDFLHITGVWNFPTIAACVAAWFFRKKIILSPRGALNKESVLSDKTQIKRVYYIFFLKPLFSSAVFHFTSSLDYKRFLEFNKSEIPYFISPNGFEIEKYIKVKELKPFYKTDRKYILFLGRVDRIKGLDLLIRSYAILYKKYENIDLVIAGPDNDNFKDELLQMINELSLGERVFFTGMLNFDEKISALNNCEFLVLPSYSENFGNVVVEALLCRKTVIIGKNVGVCEEISTHKAGIITDYDYLKLAAAIEKLITELDYRNQLADNGFKFACDYYDIKKIADEMLTEYKKLV